MTIQAISGVKNNGYTNVSFEGRKNKSSKNPQITSPMKAVPLAVLVALSPMTTTNAEQIMRSEKNQNVTELTQTSKKEKVIDKKTIEVGRNKVIVSSISTDGDDSNFEVVKLRNAVNNGIGVGGYDERIVTGIEYSEPIIYMGNAKCSLGEYAGVRLKSPATETSDLTFVPEIKNYIMSLMSSDANNNALKKFNVSRDAYISPEYILGIQTGEAPNNIYEAKKLPFEYLGKNNYRKVIDGDVERYVIRGFQKNKPGFEFVTVQGAFPEVKVLAMINQSYDMKGESKYDLGHKFEDLIAPVIILTDMDSNEPKYAISDVRLSESLLELTKSPHWKSAFKVEDQKYIMYFDENGYIHSMPDMNIPTF